MDEMVVRILSLMVGAGVVTAVFLKLLTKGSEKDD